SKKLYNLACIHPRSAGVAYQEGATAREVGASPLAVRSLTPGDVPMKRCAALALLAGLFVWSGLVLGQEAIAIRQKQTGEGESLLVNKSETTNTKMKVVDGQGKVLNENSEKTTESQEYKENMLKRDGNKVVKVEREYSKAELKKGEA